MVAAPALVQAAAPPKAKSRPFTARATVTSVNVAARTLTVNVVKGNRPMKPSIGKDVTVAVGDARTPTHRCSTPGSSSTEGRRL